MAWIEDPSVFMEMDAKSVTAGAISGEGYLDQESELILNGEAVIVDYLLTVKTETFGGLAYGDPLKIEGIDYKVEYRPMKVDDGTFCRVPLVRVTPERTVRWVNGKQVKGTT